MKRMPGSLWIAALIGVAACGAGDAPQPDAQAEAAAESARAGGVEPAPAASEELPPGLADVVVDDADRSTADQPTGSGAPRTGSSPRPSGPLSPATRPPTAEPTAPATAAQEDTGAEVLRRAATAYENVRSMQADFVMRFTNPLLRQQTTSRGTLYQQRPDRIALRFTDPDGDLILGDGSSFYVYQPSIDPNQATRSPASAGGGGGVDLQAQFIGNPVERFRYTHEGRESVAERPADVMVLVPRERAEYRSLKVWFDTADSLARRFEITEHNGSVRRFDLSGLRTNPSIPAAVFRFTAPAGVRIVNVG